jgi:hypothetical protein
VNRAGDGVGEDEAKTAVREAHGDTTPAAEYDGGEGTAASELASAADAAAVRDRWSDSQFRSCSDL